MYMYEFGKEDLLSFFSRCRVSEWDCIFHLLLSSSTFLSWWPEVDRLTPAFYRFLGIDIFIYLHPFVECLSAMRGIELVSFQLTA